MSTIKVFIRQPMKDKTDEQILAERNYAIKEIKKQYGNDNDVIVLDSFFQGAPHDANAAWFLGQSILVLSQADVACFVGEWKAYRGCRIENMIAKEYGIKTMELDKNRKINAEELAPNLAAAIMNRKD